MELTRSFQNGSKRQESLIAKLQKSSVGGEMNPTSGDNKFDLMVHNNFRKMIEEHKKKNQAKKDKGSNTLDAAELNGQCAVECSDIPGTATELKKSSTTENIAKLPPATMCKPQEVSSQLNCTSSKSTSHSPPSESSRPKNNRNESRIYHAQPHNDSRHHANNDISPKRAKLAQPYSRTPRSSPPASGGSSIIGPWQCQACTFINEIRKWADAKCQMCESGRTKDCKSVEVVDIDC